MTRRRVWASSAETLFVGPSGAMTRLRVKVFTGPNVLDHDSMRIMGEWGLRMMNESSIEDDGVIILDDE